jgi:hypothetical protein
MTIRNIASSGKITEEFDTIWIERAVDCSIGTLSQHFSGGTEESRKRISIRIYGIPAELPTEDLLEIKSLQH